jgi:hypothetical protein
MSRKKSVRLASKAFCKNAEQIVNFLSGTSGLKDSYRIWCAEYGIIRLYMEFEVLMLKSIVGAINNDTKTISESSGLSFPKHLTQDVCTYLIIGNGYFDFRGRDGLIGTIKKYVPKDHYLTKAVKNDNYKSALEQLIALRNFSAHRSAMSKKAAVTATGGVKIGSAGKWLMVEGRFISIVDSLSDLAEEIESGAPY